MAQSTTTLLQLLQEVLLNIGERPLSSYQSLSDTDPRKFPARKAYSGIKDALANVQNASDFGFLKTMAVYDAADWTNELLTITDTKFTRLLGVTRFSSGFGYELQYVTRAEYYTMDIREGIPLVYCPLDVSAGTILFNPWPVTDEDKVSLKVEVVGTLPALGTTDAGLLPVPEYFVPYIRTHAEGFMLENHLGDANGAVLKYRQAEQKLSQLITRYQNVASGHRTLYRGRRKYNG